MEHQEAEEGNRVIEYLEDAVGFDAEPVEDVHFSDSATQRTDTTLESRVSEPQEKLSLADEWKKYGKTFLSIDNVFVCKFCVPDARQAGYKLPQGTERERMKGIVKHTSSKAYHGKTDLLRVSKVLRHEGENDGSTQGNTTDGTAATPSVIEKDHYTARERYDLLLRVVSVHRWSFSEVEEPTLAEFLRACKVGDKSINRKNVKDDIFKVSTNLRHEILAHLVAKKEPVLLMIDAGTIVGRSFVNLSVAVVAEKPLVLFWRSFEPQVRLQTSVIRECVEKVMSEFEGAGIPVIGCVADNASNMQNAINPPKDAAAATDEGEGDDDGATPADPVVPFINDDVATQLEAMLAAAVPGKFFFPIRCWAHTLQLIFQDSFKHCKTVKNVFEFSTELYVALKTRAATESMRRFCALKEVDFHLPPRPCETRWNSHFMFLKYIVDHLNMIDHALRETNTALQSTFQKLQQNCALVAVALNPIAIMTDFVQSDECTLTEAIAKFTLMMEELEAMRGFFSTEGLQCLREELNAILDVVIKSAKTRNITNLENTFVKIIRYLTNPSAGYRMTHFKFASEILTWFCKDVCTYDGTAELARKELLDFTNGVTIDSLPTLSRLLLTSQRVLVTEAAVERAFHTQALTHTPERNRMAAETVEMLLFVDINENRFKEHSQRKVSTRSKLRDSAPKKLRAFTNTDILQVITTLTNNCNKQKIKTRQATQGETKAMVAEMSKKINMLDSLFVRYDNGTWYRGVAKKPMNAQGEVPVTWVVGGRTGNFKPLEGEWCFAFRPDPRRTPDLDWYSFVDQE